MLTALINYRSVTINNMTDKEQQILLLLEQGKSYSYIQQTLQVSPSKVAWVKKNLYSGSSASENQLNTTTEDAINSTTGATTGSNGSSKKANQESENDRNSIYKPKNLFTMTNYYENDEEELDENEKVSLEKYRLQLAHQLELKKLENQEREIELKKKDLEIKSEMAFSEKRKTEKQEKNLLHQYRKLAKRIEEREWTYGDIYDVYSIAYDLKEDIEKFSVENDIETEGLSILVDLDKIITIFDDLYDGDEYDESTVDLEFDKDILEIAEYADNVTFKTRE
jgi:hypothetical protein